MNKLFVLLISFVSTLFFSQNTRFIYEVSMKKDSTNRNDVKTELAYLDVVGQKSMFYAEKRIKRDSIMQVVFQSQGSMRPDRSAMQNLRSDINYTIEKNLADQKVEFRDRIAMDIYAYNEDRPMNWKIKSETAKIGDYKAQKAELDFGGRHWIAWFTQDIPVMDGPYKFYGLPGLIIKIDDSKGDYSFLLKETKKNAQIANLTNMGNIIKVKRADYLKQMEKYKKDPSSFFSQSGGGHSFGPRTIVVGVNSSNPDARKRMEERIKEEQKTNNNPIELK